ncbi:MAG: leucine-rich repeat domain-containing protein [Oscillibacter sp.]|nr:leucine-rich repeat domain-containing protein [Oscillibacter sp.]
MVWDTRPTKSESLGKSGGRYYFSQQFAFTPEFDVIEDDEIFVGFYMSDGYRFNGITGASLSFSPPAAESNIALGEYFKAKGNFPDITQLDFVKAICGLFGLFVVPSGSEDTIKFASIDLLVGNKANAADWSGKLIRDRADGDPREIKYSYGEFARRNWFKYKDDDTVETSGTAALEVNNEALEPEKDAISIPFAATDEKATTFGGVATTLARIPHYELNDDGNPQDVALTPRLVCMRGGGANGNEAYARFIPISFANMIARYYQQLGAILNSAVVIKEKFRLTEYDILGLDYTKPVYLKQYGRYYGIVSVQTESDICTVELLQLPETAPEVLALLFSQNSGETWTSVCPTRWEGRLVVKTTPGRNLTAEDISNIAVAAASSGVARRLDLSACTFISDEVPVVNTEVSEGVYSLDNIWYLHFPENVRVIKRKAFYYASKIYQFFFPEGIREFAWQSFEYCYNIRIVNFPESVEFIDDVAFGHCYKLTTIRFYGSTPPTIVYSAFHSAGSDMSTTKRVYVPAGSREAYYAQPGIARIVDDFGFTLIEY